MGLIKNLNRKFKPFIRTEKPQCLMDKAVKLSQIKEEDFKNYDKMDLFYYLFENIFYDTEVVTKIQKNYIKFLPKNSKNAFLDIGCGRGEFLGLLKQNNIKAKGIDINRLEADLLSKDYDVECCGAITFLKKTDEIYSGISAIQVVEHLDFNELFELIELSYQKIEKNGVLILETLNPSNNMCAKMFYNDFTHVHPVPKSSLQFLCEFVGFKNIKLCESLHNGHGYVNYALICEKTAD